MKRILIILILATAGLALYLRKPADILTVMREGQTP